MTRTNSRLKMTAAPPRSFRLVGGRLKTESPAAAPNTPAPKPAPVSPPSDEQIRVTAYHKWCEAGCPTGDGVAFWLAAERELRHSASQ